MYNEQNAPWIQCSLQVRLQAALPERVAMACQISDAAPINDWFDYLSEEAPYKMWNIGTAVEHYAATIPSAVWAALDELVANRLAAVQIKATAYFGEYTPAFDLSLNAMHVLAQHHIGICFVLHPGWDTTVTPETTAS